MTPLGFLAVVLCVCPIYIIIIFFILKYNKYEYFVVNLVKYRGQKNIIETIVRNISTGPHVDAAILQLSSLTQLIDDLFYKHY